MRKKPVSRGARSSKKRRARDEQLILPGLLRHLGILFCLGMLLAGLLVVGYLDFEIRQRFRHPIQTQPAHIYARPIWLQTDNAISPTRLVEQLKLRGYRAVKKISEPGSYVVSGNLMDIYANAVPAGQQKVMPVRITFKQDKIASVVDHRSAREIDGLFLEPQFIGSLQLGSYEDRIALKLHQMPELLIKAVLAMEDRNFEHHIGVDPKGILRALWSNLRQGKAVQGGSTLTQQLVKNLFLSPRRSLSRKAIEAMMAIIMELRFSKAEILEMYLNEVFLGQSGNRAVHGFALASQYFFGRSISQLKPHEIALLVGIIPAPSYYNPRRHPQRAVTRRNLVLNKLTEVNILSEESSDRLTRLPLEIVDIEPQSSSRYPAYMDYLHRQLRQYYSEEVLRTGGLKLYTSLDTGIQKAAQQSLSRVLPKLEASKALPENVLQGAVVVVDIQRGEILALVGDRVKGFSGFNRAVDAERPIGSLIKPAVYLSALKRPGKYSLATVLDDRPLTLNPENGEPWSPQNYDKEFRGPVPLYLSLMKSLNVPTVRLGLDIGVGSVIDTMRELGVERDIARFPSTLLGASQHSPLEMAQIYQTLANEGVRIPLRSIKSIHNHRDEAIARFPLSRQRVVDQNSTFLINYTLKQSALSGTARWLSSQFPPYLELAGKTGTTDNFRDSWFAGYSNHYLTIVWVGRDDNQPTQLSGSSGALRVWVDIMAQLDLSAPPKKIHSDIVFADIDPVTGLLANHRCVSRRQLPFIRGYQPDDFAPCSGLAQKFKSWFGLGSGGGNSKPRSIEEKNN